MDVVAAVLFSFIIIGAVQFVIALLPDGRTVQVTMPTSLPGRLQTLAAHGRRVYIVKRPLRIPLPTRVPGASITLNPLVPVEHVAPCRLPKLYRVMNVLRWLRDGIVELVENWILGHPENFARDWANGYHRDIVAYSPRHTHVDRKGWAEWPTQWWPTLATTSDWYAIQQHSLLNVCKNEPVVRPIATISLFRCTREPRVYGIEGRYDATDHTGGTGPRGQVHDRGAAHRADREPVPAPGGAASPQPADDAPTRRVRHAAAGV